MKSFKIPLFDLDLLAEEQKAIERVLESKWLTMGHETLAFEEEFKAYLGVRHAFAVSNCTGALHLALAAHGIQSGDEVICPSLTFAATVNSIFYVGATPILADIKSPEELCLSIDEVQKKISDKTKAIIVMHYAGYAGDLAEILKLANEKNLIVIEDAAHAIGATLNGKKLGSFGDASCFSFFANKNMTCGEGGMICTNDPVIASKIKLLRCHGMNSQTLDRHKGHNFSYDITEFGFNYRMDEVRASMARVQLQKLDKWNQARLEKVKLYQELLSDHPLLDLTFMQSNTEASNGHIFPVMLKKDTDRLRLMQYLKEKGIQTSIHYRPYHQMSQYVKNFSHCALPQSEYAGEHELTLPLYPNLSSDDVQYIVDSLKKYSDECQA